MGRQNGEAKVATSSIALLQERFKKLQKVREKRQEKQLLKLFESEPEPSSSFQQPAVPNTGRQQESLLSLRLNSQTNNINYGSGLTSTASSSSEYFWPNSGTYTFDNSDVDTSLHL